MFTNTSEVKDITDEATQSEFKRLVLYIQKSLSERGIERAAFSVEDYFTALPFKEKISIISSLEKYCEVIYNINTVDEAMGEDLRFIWSAIKTYNIIPPSDFLDSYRKGYLFELYDSSGRQFFRNFEFFNVCSYTLEEIFCRPWFELYSRDKDVIDSIVSISTEYFTGKRQGAMVDPIRPHILTEIASESLNEATVELKAFIPMGIKNSSNVYVAAVADCTNLISKKASSCLKKEMTNETKSHRLTLL